MAIQPLTRQYQNGCIFTHKLEKLQGTINYPTLFKNKDVVENSTQKNTNEVCE